MTTQMGRELSMPYYVAKYGCFDFLIGLLWRMYCCHCLTASVLLVLTLCTLTVLRFPS